MIDHPAAASKAIPPDLRVPDERTLRVTVAQALRQRDRRSAHLADLRAAESAAAQLIADLRASNYVILKDPGALPKDAKTAHCGPIEV